MGEVCNIMKVSLTTKQFFINKISTLKAIKIVEKEACSIMRTSLTTMQFFIYIMSTFKAIKSAEKAVDGEAL